MNIPFLGRAVVVRTYSAGVHVGNVVDKDGDEVMLKDARRIWRWQGANTLHEIALRRVEKGSRVSEPVPEIFLKGVIELIPATPEAIAKIESVGWSL